MLVIVVVVASRGDSLLGNLDFVLGKMCGLFGPFLLLFLTLVLATASNGSRICAAELNTQ